MTQITTLMHNLTVSHHPEAGSLGAVQIDVEAEDGGEIISLSIKQAETLIAVLTGVVGHARGAMVPVRPVAESDAVLHAFGVRGVL